MITTLSPLSSHRTKSTCGAGMVLFLLYLSLLSFCFYFSFSIFYYIFLSRFLSFLSFLFGLSCLVILSWFSFLLSDIIQMSANWGQGAPVWAHLCQSASTSSPTFASTPSTPETLYLLPSFTLLPCSFLFFFSFLLFSLNHGGISSDLI